MTTFVFEQQNESIFQVIDTDSNELAFTIMEHSDEQETYFQLSHRPSTFSAEVEWQTITQLIVQMGLTQQQQADTAYPQLVEGQGVYHLIYLSTTYCTL